MENLNINLDGFATSEELREAAEGFLSLANYAKLKARAMENRALGEIEDALAQEKQCEVIYNQELALNSESGVPKSHLPDEIISRVISPVLSLA